MIPGLAETFRVLVYDRRGHSRSERPGAQGSIDEDGEDLAALLAALDLAPAHVVASSYGASIALRLATRRPEAFRSLSCHEPHLPRRAPGPEPDEHRSDVLARLEIAVRLTDGSESPPLFSRVIDRLVELIPHVNRETIDGAAHVPQLTAPERYVSLTTRAVQEASV